MAAKRVHTDLDLQGNRLLNVANWPTGGSGVNVVEFHFTYTAATPSCNLPEGTTSVPFLYNEGGLVIIPPKRTLSLSGSQPTLTLLPGATLEGDTVYVVAMVSSPSPDPDPDPDPEPSGSTSYATATYDTLTY